MTPSPEYNPPESPAIFEEGVAISPLPTTLGVCPSCKRGLRPIEVLCGGFRLVVDGVCDGCDERVIQDLPNGTGLNYPATLRASTGEVIDPAWANWFSDGLASSWSSRDSNPLAVEVVGQCTAASVVVLNCLEPVYGHALLRLLGTERAIRAVGSERVVLLVPDALEAFVPPVAETWLVREPVRHLEAWSLEFEARFRALLESKDSVSLVALPTVPHPATYSLEFFTGWASARRSGSPSIAFALRDDARTWGKSPRAQARNVSRVVEKLGEHWPDAGFVAIGRADPGGLPAEMLDLRCPAPDVAKEKEWVEVSKGADVMIGVHGSHFLLPSGLAASSIELLQGGRLDHFQNATLVPQREPLSARERHRVLYSSDLRDAESVRGVTPELVAAVAGSLVTNGPRFTDMMTGPASGQSAGRIPIISDSGEQLPTDSVPVRALRATRTLKSARTLRGKLPNLFDGRRTRPR